LLIGAFLKVSGYLLRLLHRSRKNKGRAPLRGCVPYRYVFSSSTVNPFYLSLIFEKASSIGLKFGE
jgi:hypothetical protein